jgi:Na+/H+ antiporter NhaD/arsenite permease-like protein
MELLTAGIFAFALLAIVLDWIDRTKIALLGAALVVLIGAIGPDLAVNAIDWQTLGLLVGMMILVVLTEPTGVFGYVGLHAAKLSKGRPMRLLLLIGLLTGVLSAFLDNLTAILLVLPVAFTVARLLKMSPIPLVITEILASNLGGTATMIGDPPNIMIAGYRTDRTFIEFLVNLAPPAFVALGIAILMLRVMFRNDLRYDAERAHELELLNPRAELRGTRRRRILALTVLGTTIVAFFAHSPLGLAPAVVALCGATAMLVVTDMDIEHALERVEWPTLFFFIGLFVMVGALEEQGVITRIADGVQELTAGSASTHVLVIIWGAALGSALVDNIPFTAAMLPVVNQVQGPILQPYLWWALALGACFGGNATMVAAAANVAATGITKRQGHPISFFKFLVYGLPVALMSLIVASLWAVFVLL